MMRDIREDLQERANLLEQAINAAQQQFEKQIEQVEREQNSRREHLKAELATIAAVMRLEERLLKARAH